MELKLKKNYLTIEEIGNIVNQCAEKHTSYECELIKTVLVAKYCLDYDFGDKDDVTVYNELAEKNFLDNGYFAITNIEVLEDCIRKENSIEQTFRDFLESLNKSIEKGMKKIPKNFDAKEFIKKVEEVVGRKENNK